MTMGVFAGVIDLLALSVTNSYCWTTRADLRGRAPQSQLWNLLTAPRVRLCPLPWVPTRA